MSIERAKYLIHNFYRITTMNRNFKWTNKTNTKNSF